MKKNFLLLLFAFHFLFFTCFSQPKLVVGIVVDQMRYDYIDRYWNKFGNDGFKRLVNEGFNCKATNYNYIPTYTAPGHAAIYTGATPSGNGIVSNEWYDRNAQGNVYCVLDTSVKTVGSSSGAGKMSPKNLLSGTIGEELRKASRNGSKIIGIALKDRGAILPAGHQATAAYWYDASNGNWITSTYYMKELPAWVNNFNQKQTARKYLNQQWINSLPIGEYTESAADDNECEFPFKGKEKPVFPYDLPALMKDNGELGLIRSTPFGNSFTKDFAIETIKNENLGKGSAADMLCISFSSTDYIGHQFGPQSVEVEDCYIRLDKEIAELLKFLDEWVGKSNVLVFLTADHGAAESVPCLWKRNIPAGVVDGKTVSDSLKKFYFKTYGDSLLTKVSDFDIYLNRKRIAEKNLQLADVSRKAAEYLLKMEGIADAMTAEEITSQDFKDSIRSKVKAGFYPGRSGDVAFVLKPNWLEGAHKGTTHGSPYWYDTHVPLLWWGYNVKAGSSDEALTITQIAPTVSELLKIPVPNGCTAKPIQIVK